MRTRVAIVYNEPHSSHYGDVGEEKAVLGVLDAVEAVHRALLQLDFDVIRVPLLSLAQAKMELKYLHTDLVFNLFEGFCGYPETEALVPEILSQTGIPFTGCPGQMMRLSLDKAKLKAFLKTAGIQTPDFQLLNPQTSHTFQLDYPCIVKPRFENASHGLSSESVVNNFEALERQVRKISSSYGGDALVEEFIDGREFNATIMGDGECTLLPISEIVYSLPSDMPRILTFAAKWEPDSLYFQNTKVVCPADLKVGEQKHISEIVRSVFKLLGGKGYIRVDMRLDQEGQLNVLEVNSNPDISPGTGAARQAGSFGMTYTQFIEKIVQLALDGKRMEINIRSMIFEDKPIIMKILHNTPEFKPSEVAIAEELIDCYLRDPLGSGYHILVADTGSGVAGYICYGSTPLTEGTWDIYWIVVAQEKRGHGIGSRLMKSAEREIIKSEGRLIFIETSSTPAYKMTRRFHNSHGYEVVANIPDFYTSGDDKIIMQKRLR